jgi:hypothetical protein
MLFYRLPPLIFDFLLWFICPFDGGGTIKVYPLSFIFLIFGALASFSKFEF